MESFIAEKKTEGRSLQTLESYSNSFKKFFFCFDEELSKKEMNKGMVIHYKNYLQKGEDLHLASINHYLRDLRTFANWSIQKGILVKKASPRL